MEIVKILVVDDNHEKVEKISKAVLSAGIPSIIIQETSGTAARQRLRQERFDLLLVDLRLPESAGDSPKDGGGLSFFDLLLLDARASLPDEILFVTGDGDLAVASHKEVLSRGSALCVMSDIGDGWQDTLVGQIKISKARRDRKVQQFDFSIITALASELDAVIVTIPFSGIRGMQVSMKERQQNLLKFLGDFKGQLFLTSSTGVYPQIDHDFKEEDQPANEVESESFILEQFPQTNILRLAGLMGDQRLLKNYNISNLNQLVNHIHYSDICTAIEKMLAQKSRSKVYNIVAPIHPSKEEVINAQKGLSYSGERTTKGRTISPAKLIQELDFEFQYPDPRYFHL